MPNTKSAKKRLQQDARRRARNRSVKATVKTHVKKVLAAIEAGDTAKATDALRQASKKLDQAAASKVIHANTAARTKSRLSHRIKKVKQPA